MKLSDKTPEGFRRLAEKSRANGDDRVADELERMAQEAENASRGPAPSAAVRATPQPTAARK